MPVDVRVPVSSNSVQALKGRKYLGRRFDGVVALDAESLKVKDRPQLEALEPLTRKPSHPKNTLSPLCSFKRKPSIPRIVLQCRCGEAQPGVGHRNPWPLASGLYDRVFVWKAFQKHK